MSTKNQPPVDVPFTRGVRQDLEATMLPPGALLQATNLEYDKSQRLKPRGGFRAAGTATFSKLGTWGNDPARVVDGANGEQLLMCNADSFAYLSGPNSVAQIGPSGVVSAVRAEMIGHDQLGADPVGNITFCDTVIVHGATGVYQIVAYVQLNATNNIRESRIDVIDTVTQAHVWTAQITGTAPSPTIQPRLVVAGQVAFYVYATNGGTNINYFRIDLSGSTLAVPSDTNLVSDATNNSQLFDVATTSTGFVIAYSSPTGGGGAQVVTFNPAGTIVNGPFTWKTASVAAWTATAIGITGARSGSEKIHAAAYDSNGAKVELLTISSTLAGALQVAISVTTMGASPTQIAVGRLTTTGSIVAFSPYYSALTDDPRGHIYYGLLSDAAAWNGATGANPRQVLAGYSIGSKFFLDSSGGVLSIGRFNDPQSLGVTSATVGVQSHYLLLDWGASGATTRPVPVAHVADGQVPLAASNAVTGIGGMADWGTANKFSFAAPVRLGASPFSGMCTGIFHFQALGPHRYLANEAQNVIVAGGGTPMVYDGQRLFEMGFYSFPCVGGDLSNPQFVAQFIGGNLAAGDYSYRFTYEWQDASGNLYRSDASAAALVHISLGPAKVTWTIPTLHATRRQVVRGPGGTLADTLAPVRIVMYRTKASGTTFFRCSIVGIVNSADAQPVVIVDTLADASLGPDELFADLAGDQPPPTQQMTVFGQRLWGVDCSNQERIWYTKTFSDLTAPTFNDALALEIQGSGTINGIAAQDGRLYALATEGIYLAAFGDGPDNTGTGTFPTPSFLTSTANCTDSRAVLTSQTGIFFGGVDHAGSTVFMLPRGAGLPVNIGECVRDELAETPVIAGMVTRVQKARVEVLCINSDTSPTIAKILYYHYDQLDEQQVGAWTVARWPAGPTVNSIGTWNDATVLTDTSGIVYIQDDTLTTDNGTVFACTVETGDVRPFGMVGYGEVDALVLFGTKIATDQFAVSASYDSGATYPETSPTWNTATEAVGQSVIRRWAQPTQKLPYGGVRYKIVETPGGGNVPATAWHGVSLEATPLGGNARLPAASMG